jgi:hypothetical protein
VTIGSGYGTGDTIRGMVRAASVVRLNIQTRSYRPEHDRAGTIIEARSGNTVIGLMIILPKADCASGSLQVF